MRESARQKECDIVEGRLVAGHVYMVIPVASKYEVAQVIGFMKGESAIWVARMCGRKRSFTGQNLWARGYCVSTVGLDDETVRECFKRQEEENEKFDQLKMFEEDDPLPSGANGC
jgi:putative transposase